MSYYRTCPECGANLDPGEHCDCGKREIKTAKIEYKKIRMDRRRKSRELLDKAKTAGFSYPPDLHYFWEFMQEKNIGLPYCLGMIYNLGYLDAKEKALCQQD